MRKIILVFLAVLFLLPFSLEAKSAKKASGEIYQNDQYNFQIILPSGWITSFIQADDVVLKTSSVTNYGDIGTISIYAKNLPDSNGSDYNKLELNIMQELVNDAVATVKSEKSQVNMRYSRYININGNRFIVLYYTTGTESNKMDTITAKTVINSIEYNILLETNDHTDTMVDQYYQSLTSFSTLTKEEKLENEEVD